MFAKSIRTSALLVAFLAISSQAVPPPVAGNTYTPIRAGSLQHSTVPQVVDGNTYFLDGASSRSRWWSRFHLGRHKKDNEFAPPSTTREIRKLLREPVFEAANDERVQISPIQFTLVSTGDVAHAIRLPGDGWDSAVLHAIKEDALENNKLYFVQEPNGKTWKLHRSTLGSGNFELTKVDHDTSKGIERLFGGTRPTVVTPDFVLTPELAKPIPKANDVSFWKMFVGRAKDAVDHAPAGLRYIETP